MLVHDWPLGLQALVFWLGALQNLWRLHLPWNRSWRAPQVVDLRHWDRALCGRRLLLRIEPRRFGRPRLLWDCSLWHDLRWCMVWLLRRRGRQRRRLLTLCAHHCFDLVQAHHFASDVRDGRRLVLLRSCLPLLLLRLLLNGRRGSCSLLAPNTRACL